MEKLIIAGREFNSRLFLGTGKFSSNEWMEQSILASGTEMVTVAMKRVDMESTEDDMLKHIVHPHIQLLPNTSGVRNAEEAVFAAQMAREAFGTNWLKLEIHPDPRYLLPLLPGRSGAMQTTGRSGSCHGNAAGSTYRNQ